MKRLFTFVIVMGAAFHCHAQDNDDFESFRSGLMDEFQSFRQEVLTGYTDFLRTAWEDFNVFRSESRDSKPKPRTAPTVDSPSPQPTTPEPPANHPTPAATPPAPGPAPAVHNNITLDFYGTRLMLPALEVAALRSSDNNGVADFWQALDSQGLGSKTGNALKEIAERHRFNDWMMLKLVETYVANQLSTASADTRIAMRQYLLCHTGYDVRVAQNDGCLALLVPYSTTIYSSSYIDVDGKRFTLVFDAKSGRTTACGSVRTYRLPGERNAGGLIDPVFRQAPRVTESMVSVKLTDKKTSVACNVNANLAKLLYDYPQIPLIEYSRSSLQPSFRKELTSQLRLTTAGMTPEAAVGTLLNLVQHAFKYATDQEQFGFEKPLFPEESAIYGINDCEDRALLFCMLIKQVTGLDCLLVEYPGHVACAVRLPEYQGNGTCYSFEGHRYVLTDPTFVGAKIGMCMPAYRGSYPKLSKLD